MVWFMNTARRPFKVAEGDGNSVEEPIACPSRVED